MGELDTIPAALARFSEEHEKLPVDSVYLFIADIGIYVGALDSSDRKLVFKGMPTMAVYAHPEHLLFERDGALMIQGFDTRSLGVERRGRVYAGAGGRDMMVETYHQHSKRRYTRSSSHPVGAVPDRQEPPGLWRRWEVGVSCRLSCLAIAGTLLLPVPQVLATSATPDPEEGSHVAGARSGHGPHRGPEVRPDVTKPVVPVRTRAVRDVAAATTTTAPAPPRKGRMAKELTSFGTPIFNFDGQSYTNLNPPDPVIDVGPGHVIQMINATEVAVYAKATATLVAQFDLAGLGGCATGSGDPIVVYDPLADRWLLTEFGAGNSLCVFVSQSSDPLGAYFSYQFSTPGFPNYPKYAVWPDAYYVTTGEPGPTVYALDRTKILSGLPATSQRFTVPSLSGFGFFQGLTPGDLDGAAPPPGAPGIVMRHRDTEVHGPAGFPQTDLLEIWAFHVDFAVPANSTLTQLQSVQVSNFDSTLCGLTSPFCMAMPGVAQGSPSSLDPIRAVIMHRLVYRNFGSHETLVGSFVTDVDGNDTGGVRWFELRRSGAASWTLHQEGTHSPSGDNRWMSSIAMDGAGDVALGYNVSSPSVYPSLRYAGRLAGDPLGTLPQGEHTLVDGTAANASNRYGDYSAMVVDPTDDCTFWFTGEWNANPQWSTRIASFRFPECLPLFADGFESGNTTAWSSTVP